MIVRVSFSLFPRNVRNGVNVRILRYKLLSRKLDRANNISAYYFSTSFVVTYFKEENELILHMFVCIEYDRCR